jgi:3-oxoacyl-[acyl-carrier protein] reductase
MAGKHEGKVMVVTGSSRGIGLSIAQKLSDEGASVVVLGRNIDTAREAYGTLSTRDSMAIRCDVSVEADTLAMAEAVIDRYGRVDALINNAGVFPVKLFEDMTLEDWNQVIGIDLTGTFLATKAIYPIMARQKRGKIINMASVAGRIGGFGLSHYSASKGGVIAFTKALARECARLNIQVNAVAPGIVETDMAKVNFPAISLKEQTRQTPAGRLGRVEDLTGVISFLCSPESDYIVGQVIAVDGGYTMMG